MPGCLLELVQSFPFWRFSVQAVLLLFLLFSCLCPVSFFPFWFCFSDLVIGFGVFPFWFCFSDLVIGFCVSRCGITRGICGRVVASIRSRAFAHRPFADHSAVVLDMVFQAMLSRTRRAGRLTRPGDIAVRGAVDARAVFGGAL